MEQKLLGELHKLFRPEFLNRVDAVLVFRALNSADIRAIVRLEVEKIRERLVERGFELTLTEAAQDWFAAKGYSEEFGARPLKRLLQQELETPLSDALLAGTYQPGDTVVVECNPSGIMLSHFHLTEEPELVASI